MLKTLVELAREEGVAKLFKGLSPALQRQMVFASVKMAIYEPVKRKNKARLERKYVERTLLVIHHYTKRYWLVY